MNVELTYDEAALTKSQHDSMKAWHSNMSQQHAIAAEWHSEQSELLSKAMVNVPLDPEKSTTSLGGEKGGTTSAPSSATPSSREVPLDPAKKMDLVEILKSHVDEYGEFSKSVEEIVAFITGQ